MQKQIFIDLNFFQQEVLDAAGKEALELGLLFGNESLPTKEEEADWYCFLHLMFQEFAAAKFISTADKVCLCRRNILFAESEYLF